MTTGKYKQPKDQEKFDWWVDHMIDTNGFCSHSMAEKEAFKKVGYDIIDCPYCQQNKDTN